MHKAALIRNGRVHALMLVDRFNIPQSLKDEWLVFDPPPDVKIGYECLNDGSFVIPTPDFAAFGKDKLAEVNLERKRRLDSLVVTVNGCNFDGDEESVRNLSSILAAGAAGLPISWPIDWRDADNVVRKLTQTEALVLAGTLMHHVQAIYDASWHIKDVLIPAAVAAHTIQSFEVGDDTHWS
jgi:hypothetical protein